MILIFLFLLSNFRKKKNSKSQISIGISLFPIENMVIPIENKPIPIGNPVRKKKSKFKLISFKKENQFGTVLKCKRQTECIKVQSEDTVIQQK